MGPSGSISGGRSTSAGLGPDAGGGLLRKKVRVPPGVESAVVTVRALRTCMVYWDQKDRVLVAAKPNEWKEPHSVV